MITIGDEVLALSAAIKWSVFGAMWSLDPLSDTVTVLGFGSCGLASDSIVLDLGKYVHTESTMTLAVSNVGDVPKKDGRARPKNGDQSAPFRTTRCTTGQTI